MIYLSNFKVAKDDPRAISIAASNFRSGFNGPSRKDLAPKLSMVTGYKKGEMTDVEYISEYMSIVYSHDLDALAKELDGKVLLCHCSKDEFCHRLLLGAFLNIETGIEVEELGGFSEFYAKDFAAKVHPMDIVIHNTAHDLYGKFKNDTIVGHWRELKQMGYDVKELFCGTGL